MNSFSIVILFSSLFLIFILLKTARIVPQRTEFIIERLGKYSRTLEAGFHILIPFLDIVKYQRSLKRKSMRSQNKIVLLKIMCS